MGSRFDTYCGLNCGACPVGMANVCNDTEAIVEMANEWGREPEDLKCTGCKTDVTAVFCTDCHMRLCAREKGLEFCIECDAYPCSNISEFRNDQAPHHSIVFTNLEQIRQLGIEKWLENQKERWSCSECGCLFSWYSETCGECGGELYNAVKEEEDLKI